MKTLFKGECGIAAEVPRKEMCDAIRFVCPKCKKPHEFKRVMTSSRQLKQGVSPEERDEMQNCESRDKNGCDGVCDFPKGHRGFHSTIDLVNGEIHRFWWKGEQSVHEKQLRDFPYLCTGCGNGLEKNESCLCLQEGDKVDAEASRAPPLPEGMGIRTENTL